MPAAFELVAHRQLELRNRMRMRQRNQRAAIADRHQLNPRQPFQRLGRVDDDDGVAAVGGELRRPHGAGTAATRRSASVTMARPRSASTAPRRIEHVFGQRDRKRSVTAGRTWAAGPGPVSVLSSWRAAIVMHALPPSSLNYSRNNWHMYKYRI